MKIDAVSNTSFSSNASTIQKAIRLQINNKKYVGIKPIKNYAQYIREYGLDIKSGKK